MPNPRGSIGWGQEFEDDINGDWGGRAYEDVMKGTDWAEALPYVAKGRTSAAGASYGGYLINWIAGHTDRYRALVSHDGVFDLSSMYGSTEELWFAEWEFKGTPWDNPEMYAKWSPHLFVKEFKTPTLVVHSSLDYRVPIEQGLAMFTSLKRRGVPSRFLTFPDENHWVLEARQLGALVRRGPGVARSVHAVRAKIAGTELAYAASGKGPAVLFLHAFPLGLFMWEAQAVALEATHTVVRFDDRGFGDTPVGDGLLTMERIADDAAALLDHLGISQAVVAGCSMGGYATLAFARRHPIG